MTPALMILLMRAHGMCVRHEFVDLGAVGKQPTQYEAGYELCSAFEPAFHKEMERVWLKQEQQAIRKDEATIARAAAALGLEDDVNPKPIDWHKFNSNAAHAAAAAALHTKAPH